MSVKTYKLSKDDIESILKAGGFRLWMHKRKSGQFKLRKHEANITSVHHLVQKLMTGKNVYEHFLPKNEPQWLVAVLADESHVLHPYHALISACQEFVMHVPDFEKSKDEYSWTRIKSYVRRMDMISDGFQGQVGYDILIRLRPYVYSLLKELTAHYK